MYTFYLTVSFGSTKEEAIEYLKYYTDLEEFVLLSRNVNPDSAHNEYLFRCGVVNERDVDALYEIQYIKVFEHNYLF